MRFPSVFSYSFRLSVRAILVLLLTLCLGATASAQKNKVYYDQLDVIKGLLFVPNTIDPFSGTAVEEFPDGKKKMSVPVKNGRIHGTVKEWARNGKKVYEANYENGLQSGTERQWHANGTKSLEINYVDGKPEGVCTEWFKNEQKKSEGLFVNGKEEGKHQWWYDNGNLDQLVFYQNGLSEGTVQSWHRNGQERLVSEYRNGKQHGPSREWYINGQLKHESAYVDGLEDGEFRHWSPKGKLLSLKVYRRGELVEDYNYRSGSIRKRDGYIQVFNEKESFFTVAIEGEEVLPRRNTNITFALDGMLLQLFNIPVSEFTPASPGSGDEQQLLEKYFKFETDYIRKMTGFDIQPQVETARTASGKTYLFWHFVSPDSEAEEQKARTVQEEYYLSIVCNKRILSLYSVVTNSDDPSSISALLKKVADTVVVHSEPIDLNGVVRNIQQENR